MLSRRYGLNEDFIGQIHQNFFSSTKNKNILTDHEKNKKKIQKKNLAHPQCLASSIFRVKEVVKNTQDFVQ